MKYESTILKRLIDTYGVVGNPQYISEIIKEFIVQGKECYPNLFTYQSDWLAHIDEFGLNPSYTVTYTGQSIYAPNTLERPVKSAILSGNTLVNLVNAEREIITSEQWTSDNITNVKPNTMYTFIYTLKCETTYTPQASNFLRVESWSNNADKFMYGVTHEVNPTYKTYKVNFTTPSNIDYMIVRIRNGYNYNCSFKELMIIEGDYTNIDIPYFEGMQSVKMPVLTTKGKNLFDITRTIYYDGNGIKGNTIPTSSYFHSIFTGQDGGNAQRKDLSKLIKLSKGVYSFSGVANKGNLSLYLYDLNGNTLSQNITLGGSISVLQDSYADLLITTPSEFDITDIQLEEGSTATPYEPYKSNILTVNEEVELRGIGEVQDTLDLLTGEVTERIGEVVLDGSENWSRQGVSQNNSDLGIYYSTNALPNTIFNTNNVLCDKFKSSKTMAWHSSEEDIYVSISTYGLKICFDERKLESTTVGGFKKWLSENTPTIQYPLVEKPIKTVGLTILDQNGQNVKQLMTFNGGTHFITGSSEGLPLPTVSVSVETDLEETLKVCSLDGNTL